MQTCATNDANRSQFHRYFVERLRLLDAQIFCPQMRFEIRADNSVIAMQNGIEKRLGMRVGKLENPSWEMHLVRAIYRAHKLMSRPVDQFENLKSYIRNCRKQNPKFHLE